MTPDQLLGLASVLFALCVALIVYVWTDFKRTIKERLGSLDKKINDLQTSVNASSPAVLRSRIRNLEGRYELIHRWKNEQLPMQLQQLQGNLYGVVDTHKQHVEARLRAVEEKIK